MDTPALMKQYRGRLAFHGGMSIQKWLPFGTVADVKREARKLIDAGREGGYIFSPSHAVPGDVPPENLVAMMEVLREQPGYAKSAK
jgi:uroporphyrinogen decarboxylase